MRGGYRYSQYQDGQTLWQVKEQEFADKLLNDGQPTPPKPKAAKRRPSIRITCTPSELIDGNGGACIACGEHCEGIEPDAHEYTCQSCGTKKVYGYQELLIVGKLHLEGDND